MPRVRHAYVAGSWYAGTAQSLRRQIEEECFLHRLGPGEVPRLNPQGPRKLIALLSPHAGYMYSGPVAAHGYNALAKDGKPDLIIAIGPNHTGLGSGVSLMEEGVWRTPLGEVEIDSEVAKEIQRASKYIDFDYHAHLYEHSIELQLPFLQYVIGDFKFVPICMMLQELDVAADVGRAVAKAIEGRNALIVATTDMTHYEPQHVAERKDSMAIEAILKLDEEGLNEAVNRYSITMCGVGPTIAMIVAAKKLGAKRVELLKYATSGDVTGDRSAVVGYCSMAVYGG